ncbi:MAG TPA: hypothetical protein VGK59_10985 [Ohtaekwangia sp.]
MSLNVHAVLKKAAEKKAAVKPLPKVRHVDSDSPEPIYKKALSAVTDEVKQAVDQQVETLNKMPELLAQLKEVKKERAKLSSRTPFLISEVCAKLRKESKALEEQFMDGMLESPEVVDHVAKIDVLSVKAQRLHDEIEHVKKYGVLPREVIKPIIIDNNDSDQVKVLQLDIRRLSQNLSKTKLKLQTGKPMNIARKAMWNEKISLMEARIAEKKRQLNRLQDEAKAKSPGRN